MTAYDCPMHGRYEKLQPIPGLRMPEGLRTSCPQCQEARMVRQATLQADYDRHRRRWHHWLDSSGIPARNRNRTLANWTPRGAAQELAGKIIHRYADNLAANVDTGDGLTLSGPPGVGKTHLATALVSAAAVRGIHGHYVCWPDAVERHKATFGRRDADDIDLMSRLQRWPLLIIDEIGMRTSSDFERGLLFELVDARYREELATVVATNLTPDQLDTIGERTADRLREANATVVIPGTSRRTEAATDEAIRFAPWALQEPVKPVERMQLSMDGALEEVTLTVDDSRAW
ncbi:MAG: ATP-binding protein [Proteobacteria bacterium]|nr:ATP-binding protein [Pseudomonadota bacterium]